MNRRGFALVAALWILAVASAIGASAMTITREGMQESRNRVALTRGRWAGEACEAIFRARFAASARLVRLDTVDLGRGTWCRASLDDPAARINLNTADPDALRRILMSDSLVDALLDWRDADSVAHPLGAESSWYRVEGRTLPRNGPLVALEELRLVRGFERLSLPDLDRIATVSAGGGLNLNVASVPAMKALGVFDDATIARIRSLQSQSRRLEGVDDLLGAFDAASQERLAVLEAAFAGRIGFTSGPLLLHVAGGVRGLEAVWHTTVEVVPSDGRLAVISRVIE
jgi:type II secretory pathway component PulK